MVVHSGKTSVDSLYVYNFDLSEKKHIIRILFPNLLSYLHIKVQEKLTRSYSVKTVMTNWLNVGCAQFRGCVGLL